MVFELNTDFNTHEKDQKNIKFFGLSGFLLVVPFPFTIMENQKSMYIRLNFQMVALIQVTILKHELPTDTVPFESR